MPDRKKIIDGLKKHTTTIEASGDGHKWRFVQVEIIEAALELLKGQEPDKRKYQYKYDHTDCLWYHDSRSKCPVTCSQYRDGWNDAMDFIFKDGHGYQPYKRR